MCPTDLQSAIQEMRIEPLAARISDRGARLSNAERAYIRGLCALREREFAEAHRQLSGYLQLNKSPDPALTILVETLAVFLAIQRESAILHTEMR